MNDPYPELDRLKHFVATNMVLVTPNTLNKIDPELIPVRFSIQDQEFSIQLCDEYNDLAYENPILNCVLVLREFEVIAESNDFLHWCTMQGLNASNSKLLDYYKTIYKQYNSLASYFPDGKVTSFISGMDFELSSGPMFLLRK